MTVACSFMCFFNSSTWLGFALVTSPSGGRGGCGGAGGAATGGGPIAAGQAGSCCWYGGRRPDGPSLGTIMRSSKSAETMTPSRAASQRLSSLACLGTTRELRCCRFLVSDGGILVDTLLLQDTHTHSARTTDCPLQGRSSVAPPVHARRKTTSAQPHPLLCTCIVPGF